MTYEIATCKTDDHAMTKNLLSDGWEPFAVSDGMIWFRRIDE